MDLLDDLDARGLIHDSTDRDALAARLASGPVTLYHGIDPTSDSLHTGNLVGLLMMRRFLSAGHRVLALAGGATGMVGDPSGRSSERNLLDEETLRQNVASIKAQITRVLGGGEGWRLVDNYDWTRELTLLDFLRDVGKHMTVNQMVARESVKVRMQSDQGISFTEFSYMLLQAHDYLWLHEHEGCELQIGGSDQWGNILSGIDLIRRRSGNAVHGLAWPLLTARDGAKLGKTTGARVWLDPAKTSPYQFFQHWMHADDREVRQLLAWFTMLPVDEINALAAAHEEAPERRVAQRLLAREVTELVHGAEAAAAAEGASRALFGGPLDGGDPAALAMVAAEVPSTEIARNELSGGMDLTDLLLNTSLVTSKSEARRLVDQQGISVNNVKADSGRIVGLHDVVHDRYVLLRRGRDRYHVLVVEEPDKSG